MSLKYTSFTHILDFFLENCGAMCDEHGECFHQDIKKNGTVLRLPTTAGIWQGMPLPWNTSNRQNGGGERKKICFLNNELTLKKLCRCSIYMVNIIPKQNKSTKHIIFQ